MLNKKAEQERIEKAYPFLRASECLGRNLLHAMLMQIPVETVRTMYVIANLGRDYVREDIWYIPYDPLQVIGARRSKLSASLDRPQEELIRELLEQDDLRRWITRGLHVLRIE